MICGGEAAACRRGRIQRSTFRVRILENQGEATGPTRYSGKQRRFLHSRITNDRLGEVVKLPQFPTIRLTGCLNLGSPSPFPEAEGLHE